MVYRTLLPPLRRGKRRCDILQTGKKRTKARKRGIGDRFRDYLSFFCRTLAIFDHFLAILCPFCPFALQNPAEFMRSLLLPNSFQCLPEAAFNDFQCPIVPTFAFINGPPGGRTLPFRLQPFPTVATSCDPPFPAFADVANFA